MQFASTPLEGAYVIELDRVADERGFFARSCCRKEFGLHGIDATIVQCNISYNSRKGTLRGLHYQVAPHAEGKLVRCTMGAIYDVILDLRAGSTTFGRHFAERLTAENHRMLYAPPGVAHGFLTLEDNTEVFYQMSANYNAACARGIRWDDPYFGIAWPDEVLVMSDRDRNYPDFGR